MQFMIENCHVNINAEQLPLVTEFSFRTSQPFNKKRIIINLIVISVFHPQKDIINITYRNAGQRSDEFECNLCLAIAILIFIFFLMFGIFFQQNSTNVHASVFILQFSLL